MRLLAPFTAARRRPATAVALLLAACAAATVAYAASSAPAAPDAPGAQPPPEAARLVAARDGFAAPEAVRYDPDADVYYVSNWNTGPAGALDNNGFISRLRPDGTVAELRFIAGGANGVTLHAPRGLALVGDTLWAVDADAVRGFDRRTGRPVATVSLADRDLGFLNDVAPGPDGAVYVTDTGRDRIYRVAARAGGGHAVTVALADSALGHPNGVTWDAAGGRFLVVPFGGAHAAYAWRPGAARLDTVATTGAGAQLDGVEVVAGAGGGPRQAVVASQADSSLHAFVLGDGGAPAGRVPASRVLARLAGRPADIGVDTRRGRVAVPFVARNRVELWELPRAAARGSAGGSTGAARPGEWVSLFDGRTLAGWRASEHPGTFRVEGGRIVVRGPRAHLFYEGPALGGGLTDFELAADVLTKPGANSGVYLRTAFLPEGWPSQGYEVQVNNSHSDWRRTGSLYAVRDVRAAGRDDRWFTVHAVVRGRRVRVLVDGRQVVDYTEPADSATRLTGGTIALQGHDSDSEVHYRNVRLRRLAP